VMFDENFKIKKFNSVESIIESFCKVRMEYYVHRKQKLLDDLHKKITIMTNKKRFIEEVIEKIMVINRKKQEAIERELLERGYDTDADGGFGYLLRLQVSSFTEEKIEELQASISKMQAEIEKLTATPEQTLWLDDLQNFEDDYKKWLGDMTMADAKRVKAKRPTVTGTTKTKRIKKI
jgi:DNA topoisomerase-2